MASCDLIKKAKKFDVSHKRRTKQVVYNDEEIQLAAAWMEGEVTTEAVSHAVGWDSGNVGRKCLSAIRQALVGGRIGFTWYQPDEIDMMINRKPFGGTKP